MAIPVGCTTVGSVDYKTGDRWSSWLGPFADYHFLPDDRVVPFVGGGLGFGSWEDDSVFGKTTGDDWFAEAHGGAKFFLNDNVAAKLELEYRRREEDISSGPIEQSTERTSINVVVGLAFFLVRE